MALEGPSLYSGAAACPLLEANIQKADDISPASFEKTLSALSSKIAKASNRLEGTRQQARRFKGLWTLYSSFVYLLYVVVVGLVVGWRNWGPIEYTTLSGGPLM